MPKIKLTPSQQREKDISDILKKGLIDKGWTCKHFAELMKMHETNLSRIINHPLKTKLETILIMADKLGIDRLPVR